MWGFDVWGFVLHSYIQIKKTQTGRLCSDLGAFHHARYLELFVYKYVFRKFAFVTFVKFYGAPLTNSGNFENLKVITLLSL